MNMNNSNDNDPITIVEFCAGYGGLGLGIEKAINGRMRLIGLCELEGFAQANLISKMEAGLMAQVPIWSNLLTFPYRKFRGLVDIAVAGIPCQPHSNAGKRKGGADERFLFDDWLRGLEDMRPRAIFIENVEGLLTSKMPDGTLCIAWTIERLEAMGYRVEAGIFSASEVGAPHQRKRVFILAYRKSEGLERYNGLFAGCGESRRDASEQKGQASWGNSGGNGKLADSTSDRLNGCVPYGEASFPSQGNSVAGSSAWPSRPGQPQHGWEPPRVVGNSADAGQPQRGQGTVGQSKSEQEPQRPNCNQDNAECKIKFAMGLHINGTPDGVGLSKLSGLSDSELAEICHWMVASDNRTDELRLLGNGVVPATAERAFRELSKKFLLP